MRRGPYLADPVKEIEAGVRYAEAAAAGAYELVWAAEIAVVSEA